MGRQRRKTAAPAGEEQALRRALIETAQAMSREGLSPVRSGNVSGRMEGGMLITPTGLAYEGLDPDDLVLLDEAGERRPGALKPSSEWQMHRAVYRARPDIAAIVHCHSMNATALACAQRPIPAFHYMVAVAGGTDIPLAPYATFGTLDLADAVAATLRDRNAALLAHHGQIACGPDLASALDLAREVETLAGQYCRFLQIGGEALLGEAEMTHVLDKFRGYGQQ